MKRRRLTVRLSPAGNREALEEAVEVAARLAVRRALKHRDGPELDDRIIDLIAENAGSALWEVLEVHGIEVV